jgi:hypothetical protein
MPGDSAKSLKCQLALWVAGGGRVKHWYKKHGVSASTAYQWSKSAPFKRLVEEYRRRALDRAIGRMARGLGKAVEKITELIEAGQTDAVKLSAAKTLVDKLIDVQNHAELRADLRRLDERLGREEERRASGNPKPPAPAGPA